MVFTRKLTLRKIGRRFRRGNRFVITVAQSAQTPEKAGSGGILLREIDVAKPGDGSTGYYVQKPGPASEIPVAQIAEPSPKVANPPKVGQNSTQKSGQNSGFLSKIWNGAKNVTKKTVEFGGYFVHNLGYEYSEAADGIQTTLDVAGFTPVGVVTDPINGTISLARGKWAEAGVNFAAAIPIAGDALKAGKMAKEGVEAVAKYGDEGIDAAKNVTKSLDEKFEVEYINPRTGQVHEFPRLHVEHIPDHVPENWGSDTIQAAIEELKISIKNRKADMARYDEMDPDHFRRIQNEEDFLRQLESKLKDLGGGWQ